MEFVGPYEMVLGVAMFPKVNRERAPWTEEEDKFLRDNFRTMSFEEISRQLHRNTEAARYRANVLGLKRTREEMNMIRFEKRLKTIKENETAVFSLD